MANCIDSLPGPAKAIQRDANFCNDMHSTKGRRGERVVGMVVQIETQYILGKQRSAFLTLSLVELYMHLKTSTHKKNLSLMKHFLATSTS